MDRVQADPKLASALLPQRVANAQLASLRMNSPSKKSSFVREGEPEGSRDVTPQSSPSKARRTTDRSAPPSSPSKGSGSPSKLVLNPQNPHLKKMRSSQQLHQAQQQQQKAASPEKGKMEWEEKMPGARPAEQGMEHVGMLADVLYGRWTEGLRARWPLA